MIAKITTKDNNEYYIQIYSSNLSDIDTEYPLGFYIAYSDKNLNKGSTLIPKSNVKSVTAVQLN